MILGLNLKTVLEFVGHDGSKIKWPGRRNPHNRVGFQIEEFSILALKFDYALVPFVSGIEFTPPGESIAHCVNLEKQLEEAKQKFDGIILGHYLNSGGKHAVAWNALEGKIYDPAGSICGLENFVTHDFRAAVPTRHRSL